VASLVKKTQVPSSTGVIENFYGEPVSRSLAGKIRRTPIEQIEELARRLVRHNRSMELVLQGQSSEEDPLSISYQALQDSSFSIHGESYLSGGRAYALSQSEHFWHAVMSSDHLMIPDLALDAACQFVWSMDYAPTGIHSTYLRLCRSRMAHAVEQIAPLAPLVRDGILLPIGSPDVFSFDDHGEEASLSNMSALAGISDRVYWSDPYLAWLLVRHVGVAEEWELEALDLHRPGDFIAAAEHFLGKDAPERAAGHDIPYLLQSTKQALLESYAHGATLEDIQSAIQFNHVYRSTGIAPLTSSRITAAHLVRSSKVVIEGMAASAVNDLDPVMTAARYGIPSLRDVAIDDLVRLRLNEDIFHQVRRCLGELMQDVHQNSNIDEGFERYARAVKLRAEDIVRPTYEKLSRARTRDNIASVVGGYAAGGLVSMIINGAALATSGIGALLVRSAAGSVGNVANRIVGSKGARNRKDTETACSILMSVLDSPDD
jgi:hypothetical protein